MTLEATFSRPGTAPLPPPSMQEMITQTDAIMALEGFEKTPGSKALSEALLAGRATLDETMAFVLLRSKIIGAESVLQSIGRADARYADIEGKRLTHLEQLREEAARMGGAVRLAFDL